jgi:hypothetical protein
MQLEDTTPKLYGLLAEFDSATAIVDAAREARRVGYVKVDAYTPFPIHELDSALEIPRTRLPWIVLGGGIAGMLAGFGLQYWASVIEYPMNIGGRPYASWPAFVVPAYETTILFASITAVVAMIALNGLPQPYHPLFNVPTFSSASADRFFLCVEAADPKFEIGATRKFLQGLKPVEVSDVVD